MTTLSAAKTAAISNRLCRLIESAPRFVAESAARDEFFPVGFELIGLVSEGTVTNLWQARNRKTGTLVALKSLRDDWWGNQSACQLLKREADVSMAVRSSHLMRIVDADVELNAKSSWIAFEWVAGSTLATLLSRQPKLSASQALWTARQAADGLQHLQEYGFSHGDLQPANILLTTSGTVKLINLGFANKLSSADDHTLNISDGLRANPEIYTAPEQQADNCSNSLTQDAYSLGVVLFEMLTGRIPFENQSAKSDNQKFYSPMLKHYCPDASLQLNNLVNRLLASQPVRRPQSPAELVRQLLAVEIEALSAQIA